MLYAGEYLRLFFPEENHGAGVVQDFGEILNSGRILSYDSFPCAYPGALLLSPYPIKKTGTLAGFKLFYMTIRNVARMGKLRQ